MKKFPLLFPFLFLSIILSSCSRQEISSDLAAKADLLWAQVEASWEEPEEKPAGEAGHVVFFSMSDGTSKAIVRYARGNTLTSAWDKALAKGDSAMRKFGKEPVWLKVDIVRECIPCSANLLANRIEQGLDWGFRQGIAFDSKFNVAFLEEELNGSSIINYDQGAFDAKFLQEQLAANELGTVKESPAEFFLFRCNAWFCDENNEVFSLTYDGYNQGQRVIEGVDREYARELIGGSAKYLTANVKEDGSFVYDYYPQYDLSTDSYNIIRHAGTVWSMSQAYQLFPSEELHSSIVRAADYLVDALDYNSDGAAFLRDREGEEYTLGGSGLAILAFNEVQEALNTKNYQTAALALGEGILFMQQESGCFNQVLDMDFKVKEQFRTIYYDGEGTFALCKLYSMTGDEKWLIAASKAMDYFIANDYVLFGDHWQAYSVNELTKYIPDNQNYWDYAMAIVTENKNSLIERRYSSPTDLELLMNAFETYTRRPDRTSVSSADLETLFTGIRQTAKRQTNEFFYPEFAMYVLEPRRVLNTFFARNDFRIRIDDVQHNIGGLYLFQKDYDDLVRCGYER